MGSFVIFADASSDLSPDYLKARDVRVLPMTCLSRDGDVRTLTGYEDDDYLVEMYRDMRAGKMYSTSQITPQEYQKAFEPVLAGGQDVVYIALSSGLTSTVESATMAAEKLNGRFESARVHVVDSLSASGGIDLLLEKAVSFRDAGQSAEDAAKKLRALAKQVCHVFMVTDLMHLCRGGRLSLASAKVGALLHVIPLLIIDEMGKLEVIDKKRGERGAIKELRKRFENSWNGQDHRMYAIHGNWPEEAVRLEQEILEKDPEARIDKRIISPVIGVHTGPEMLAIIFFGDRAKLKN